MRGRGSKKLEAMKRRKENAESEIPPASRLKGRRCDPNFLYLRVSSISSGRRDMIETTFRRTENRCFSSCKRGEL